MARHGKRFPRRARRSTASTSTRRPRRSRWSRSLGRAKFDESVEVHIRTGLNVRHADEQLRGTIALPNGLGKDVNVAVFAQGDKAKEAEEAGADIVGAEDLAKRVEEGFTDFDIAIATPDLMPVVGRLGRILGPQGKMPNPKVGTVTMDVAKAVEESKAGKVEYRTDRTAIVHLDHRQDQLRRAARCSRTTPRSSTRSCAPSRPPRRAVTCARSRLRRPWGPGIKVDPPARDIVEEAAPAGL